MTESYDQKVSDRKEKHTLSLNIMKDLDNNRFLGIRQYCHCNLLKKFADGMKEEGVTQSLKSTTGRQSSPIQNPMLMQRSQMAQEAPWVPLFYILT